MSKVWVLLQTNDANDGKGVSLLVLPNRGDTFIFRWMEYRVTDVRHNIELADAEHPEHIITLVLEPK